MNFRLLSILIAFHISTLCFADENTPRIMSHMHQRVTIVEDSAITRLMLDKQNGIERKQVEMQGYRVQVFSSNNQQTAKTEAFRIQKLVEESQLNVDVYVQYNTPFWKVRLGNFRTIEEAKLFKEEVTRLLPELQGDTYTVRDNIVVIERQTSNQ